MVARDLFYMTLCLPSSSCGELRLSEQIKPI